jgi:hypothetical protein
MQRHEVEQPAIAELSTPGALIAIHVTNPWGDSYCLYAVADAPTVPRRQPGRAARAPRASVAEVAPLSLP